MDIVTWLEGVNPGITFQDKDPGCRKRKRYHRHHLPTPPPKDNTNNHTMDDNEPIRPPSPKRKRPDDLPGISSPTAIRSRPGRSIASSIISDAPRLSPTLIRVQSNRSSPTRSSNTNTNTHTESAVSNRSGRQSPTKTFTFLEIEPDHGIARRGLSLQDDDLAAPLVFLLEQLTPFAAGTGVISGSARTAIMNHPKRANRSGLDDSVYCADASRDSLGPTPSPEEVQKILSAARNCTDFEHDEASWNMEVHHRIFETALRPDSELFNPRHLVNFTSLTTAGISCGKPASLPFQKIDYCLYISPPSDCLRDIETVRHHLTELDDYPYINHTDYKALRNFPIAVSVESKRSIDGWDKAQLQLAVWQAAQFNFLRYLVAIQPNNHNKTEEEGDIAIGLDFLPGIVVAGNAWYLTAATNDGKRTVCLHVLVFGNEWIMDQLTTLYTDSLGRVRDWFDQDGAWGVFHHLCSAVPGQVVEGHVLAVVSAYGAWGFAVNF